MAYKRREYEVDLDRIAAYLQDAVNTVKTVEDIEVLANLKKTFKKNVPFSLRGYVTAYLLKNARIPYRFANDSKKGRDDDNFSKRGRSPKSEMSEKFNKSEKAERTEKSEKFEKIEKTERAPRPVLDASLTDTIFISVGRNRRVFPRDLVGLICSVVGLDRERSGDIRVLANYSFVQLLKEDADKAINTLNGYDYRGRKLSVSYSKAKDEVENSESEGDSISNTAASAENAVFDEKIPENVENVSAKVEDSFTKENADTMAQQAAFAAQQAAVSEMTDEEIMAARAPRSSSSEE